MRIMKWYIDDEVSVIPENTVRAGFAMKLNGVNHVFVHKTDGWRVWNRVDENKEDQLQVDRNKWVDYQLASMFGGW